MVATQQSPVYMHGTEQNFRDTVVNKMLDEVPLNKLEKSLVEKYLENPQACAEQVTETLKKAKNRLVDDKRACKQLGRVIPLFDKHDFWSTQPVMRVYEPIGEVNKPVEEKHLSEVQKEPLELPNEYQWCTVDMTNKESATELYDLLTNHYVEDDGGNFRFDYSMDFLQWALTPPGYHKDWLVGVRGGKNNKLYGFISGIPVKMMVHGKERTMAEINFLCVHNKLRTYRLAPMLIREITRRVNCLDIWQAIYTSGTTLPTPFGSAVYWHRNLNPAKTIDVGFAFKPPGQTMAQFVKKHRLPEKPMMDGIR
jgi:glycylpeptide N-tetradecanoyltransferase